MINWKNEIKKMYELKKNIRNKDLNDPYEYCEPNKEATEFNLSNVKIKIGVDLDEEYLGFLKIADGWNNILFDFIIFGTNDLMGSEIWKESVDILKIKEEYQMVSSEGFDIDNVLPVAYSADNCEVIVIVNYKEKGKHKVLALYESESHIYESFYEFYIQYIYNRSKDVLEML